MSAAVGGNPNIMPPAPRGTDDGYSLRPHSSSSVGQGDAELKPGTVSSERSFSPLSYTVTTIVIAFYRKGGTHTQVTQNLNVAEMNLGS